MAQRAAGNWPRHLSPSRAIASLVLAFRLGLFALYLLFGLLLALLIGAYFVQNKAWQKPVIRAYCRGLCRLLRVRIQTSGTPPSGAALVVSNHVSWLDIPVIFACLEGTSFLSKAEVRKWPLVGPLGVAAGTLFIRREGHLTTAINRQIGDQLSLGRRVVIFPEGTTTTGEQLLPFHPKLFGAAMVAGAAVQPVLLRYRSEPGQPMLAPFVGDDSFPSHLCRLLAGPPLTASINWLPPLKVAPMTQDIAEEGELWKAYKAVLAEDAHTCIAQSMERLHD